MKRVNEGTALAVDVSFLSETGTPIAPSTVHYRLFNVTARRDVIDWTEIATAPDVEISIPAQAVRIENDRNPREVQELTVVANKDLPTQVPEVFSWEVTNLEVIR